ncbi:MAG: Stk1 family PASTA domain-containing Ser/Thr kinase [Actinomycetota bacterium]|nr:Stk1 family PASTA domain-containing Ser/Thr kinase [Actinomycetota bacterium]
MAVDTMINTLVDGRYRVLRKLGTGGMANVYLAEDQELGRRVAIKVLDDRHASDEQFVERFRREAKNAAGLSHPNIVSIYDRGQTDGTYYIAMEYLEGPTLKELIRQGTPSIRTAIGYTREILAALRVAHRRGLVHRDIKPHNVLVDAEGRLKVTDFGIARSGPSQMTEAGSIIGTAQYLSPEQARGAPVDQRSDLYSLGVLLYELLTGTVPFTGATPLEIAMKHLSQAPEPPSHRRHDVPPDLDKVVLRALAKNPNDRYQTAGEMDVDLSRIERGLAVSDETTEAATAVLAGAGTEATAIRPAPVVATRPAPYGPSRYYEYEPPVRRRPLWPWLLALVLLVGAGVGGWFAYSRIQHELAQARPVSVPFVEGMVRALAVRKIVEAELNPRVVRQASLEVAETKVIRQDPPAGERIDRGNTVTIYVSTGKPKVKVPDVVGRNVDEATSLLRGARLRVHAVDVFSGKPVGEVVAQAPKAEARIVIGSTVRINVSQGPRPIAVPAVTGGSYEDASAAISRAGFGVDREDVDSDEPAGTVVDQDPAAGTLQAPGTTVTLFVSRGPQTTAVPDVLGLDRSSAIATIKNAGFRHAVQERETEDPGEDGLVLAQDPAGGAQQLPGTTVLITVGRLATPSPAPSPTAASPPTATPPPSSPPAARPVQP